jgi:hypothetical protein
MGVMTYSEAAARLAASGYVEQYELDHDQCQRVVERMRSPSAENLLHEVHIVRKGKTYCPCMHPRCVTIREIAKVIPAAARPALKKYALGG